MDPARDGDSASRRRESPLWYRGGEPPVVPGRTEPVWHEPAPPIEPPPPERRPLSARLVAVAALAMAGVALALVLIVVVTGGKDAPSAERAVRQVVIDYGHADSPAKGCPLFSRALAQRSFGSMLRCMLTNGTWRDEELTVARVRIDGDRGFAYGTSSAGDRFRYELIREDGAWRLARLHEPDGDAREAAGAWAAASGAELCELISDRLARSLYGSLSGCRIAADASPDRIAIRAIELTPRSLDRPTDAATVLATFGGRDIRMRLRFQSATELPEIDEVIDARSGEPIRR